MKLKFLLLTLGILMAWRATLSQDTISFNNEENLFFRDFEVGEDFPVEMELKFNVKKFQKEKYHEKYMPAFLCYRLTDSFFEENIKVKVKARGINRLNRCSFPPLFININKSGIDIPQLENTKKLKLVTHCGGRPYENLILKEYLAYRIYNLITPYSFKVRLVKMKYIDTGRDNKITEAWGIITEPEEMLAERLNMVATPVDYVNLKLTDLYWTSHLAIYQYMIGNPDYSIQGRHNVKLLVDKDPFKPAPIPVPYDFDYAGIVDAFYALPGEELSIEYVTDRFFLGPCRTIDEYMEIIENFCSKKEEIYKLINEFEYLPEKDRSIMVRYLDEFFENCTNERYIKKRILTTCR